MTTYCLALHRITMITVRLPSQLRGQAGDKEQLSLVGETVAEVMSNLVEEYPLLKDRLYDQSGKLYRYVNIYLGDEDVRFLDYLDTKLKDGDELSLVPAIAGGFR